LAGDRSAETTNKSFKGPPKRVRGNGGWGRKGVQRGYRQKKAKGLGGGGWGRSGGGGRESKKRGSHLREKQTIFEKRGKGRIRAGEATKKNFTHQNKKGTGPGPGFG